MPLKKEQRIGILLKSHLNALEKTKLFKRKSACSLLHKAHRHNLVEDFRNLKWSLYHYPTSKTMKLLREELIRYFGQTLDTVIWSIGIE
jgi:hypothetical protein